MSFGIFKTDFLVFIYLTFIFLLLKHFQLPFFYESISFHSTTPSSCYRQTLCLSPGPKRMSPALACANSTYSFFQMNSFKIYLLMGYARSDRVAMLPLAQTSSGWKSGNKLSTIKCGITDYCCNNPYETPLLPIPTAASFLTCPQLSLLCHPICTFLNHVYMDVLPTQDRYLILIFFQLSFCAN